MTAKDKDGNHLEGNVNYHLNVPASVPVTQYWSMTLYNRDTHAFIRNSQWVGRSSQTPGLQKKVDGSVDIYFGPASPASGETNWIPTDPNGRLFYEVFEDPEVRKYSSERIAGYKVFDYNTLHDKLKRIVELEAYKLTGKNSSWPKNSRQLVERSREVSSQLHRISNISLEVRSDDNKKTNQFVIGTTDSVESYIKNEEKNCYVEKRRVLEILDVQDSIKRLQCRLRSKTPIGIEIPDEFVNSLLQLALDVTNAKRSAYSV